MIWRERYEQARCNYYKKNYPNVVKDGHYTPAKKINVATEKGLKDFIVNFINWSGYRATDMRKAGGILTQQAERQESGTILIVKKFKATGVKKGTADVSSTIKGRTAMWEIKIGSDKPSDHQLDEQQRERAAGGIYEFVKTPEEFLFFYDAVINQ